MHAGGVNPIWLADLPPSDGQASHPAQSFAALDAAARQLGFEHCAFLLREALPVTRPRMRQISSQPAAWQKRYAQANYIDIDPVVRNSARSEAPQVWSTRLFRSAPQLWSEAQAAGLRHGWTASSLDCVGVGGMLTLTRSAEPITPSELAHKAPHMRYLVQVAHAVLGHALATQGEAMAAPLTERETDVLRRTADGMTARQSAAQLDVSVHTVNVHLKNCAAKLNTGNRSAMVARAQVTRQLA